MSENSCPFNDFKECRKDCKFFHEGVEGCLLSEGITISLHRQIKTDERLKQIEQYLLDGTNSLIDINYNTRG